MVSCKSTARKIHDLFLRNAIADFLASSDPICWVHHLTKNNTHSNNTRKRQQAEKNIRGINSTVHASDAVMASSNIPSYPDQPAVAALFEANVITTGDHELVRTASSHGAAQWM